MICSSVIYRRLRRKASPPVPVMGGSGSGILVVRLSSFGDVVLAEPLVRELAAAFPDQPVYFATSSEYAAIPTMFERVAGVVVVPRPGGGGTLPGRACEHYRLVVDIQNSLRSRRLALGLGADRVVRYRRPWARRFACVYLPWVWKGQLEHTVDLYLKALRPLGVRARASAPRLLVPEGARTEVSGRLGAGPWVGLCPGGSSPHKIWGSERFTELAGRLAASGHKVMVVGSEADRPHVEPVLAGADGREITGFVQNNPAAAAAALSMCSVTVSNDSGLMHLAAAVGSRVVGIFGPTSPLLGFGPLSPGSVALTRQAPCSPCSYHGNRACRYGSPFCLDEIKASDVASVVDGLVDRQARS